MCYVSVRQMMKRERKGTSNKKRNLNRCKKTRQREGKRIRWKSNHFLSFLHLVSHIFADSIPGHEVQRIVTHIPGKIHFSVRPSLTPNVKVPIPSLSISNLSFLLSVHRRHQAVCASPLGDEGSIYSLAIVSYESLREGMGEARHWHEKISKNLYSPCKRRSRSHTWMTRDI